MTDPQRVHEEVVSHAKRRAAMDRETCSLLLLAESLRVHEHLGYGSFREYVAEGEWLASTARCSATEVERKVLARHQGRCGVPGCSHASFVDVHHVERRADGGGHDSNLLITLCGAHHKAVHEGTLVIGGSFEAGFSFRHADGSGYGVATASPARSATLATVLTLLVGMGFKQRESQAMVDRIRPSVGAETSVEQALAAALREAPSPRCSRVREEHAVYRSVPYAA